MRHGTCQALMKRLAGKPRNTPKKTCLSGALYTASRTWTVPGMNPGPRDDKAKPPIITRLQAPSYSVVSIIQRCLVRPAVIIFNNTCNHLHLYTDLRVSIPKGSSSESLYYEYWYVRIWFVIT
jgi:hypothetical protein